MSGPTRNIGRALAQPLALISIGALILSLLVWFAAPLVAFGQIRPFGGTVVRLAALLAVIFAWGLVAVAIGLKRDGKDRRLLETLRRQEAESLADTARDRAAVDRRAGVLRRKADEVLARLGQDAAPGRSRRRADRLPWYLVVGPSRSGKSALLASAGLNLPFGPPREWGGPGDDCSFVFSEHAVFLDVSGRYAGAPAGSLDGQVWLRLLDLVRRLRRRQPICGIVLTLDVSELASLSEDGLRAHGQALRLLLDGIAERLRSRAPVYLVVNKFDRVLGFSTFFETLNRTEREQMWGVPLLMSEEEREHAPAERFRSGFAELVRRVSGWQIQRLHEEADPQRRALAYEFPDHLAALGAVLEPIVEIVAKPHRFDAPPFLRGVFLSSALQVGPAIDLIGAPAGETFGQSAGLVRLVEPASPHSRSFFLAQLLRDFVVSEAETGGLSRRSRRFSTAWQVGTAVSLAAAVAGVAAYWIADYRAVSAYASDLGTRAGAVADVLSATRPARTLPPFRQVLPILDDLARLECCDAGDAAGDAGNAKVPRLAAETRRAYAAGLERLFLPYLSERLRGTLSDASAPPILAFAALKLYLALGGARPLDAIGLPRMSGPLTAAWFPDGSAAAQRAGFAAQLAALATHPVPVQPVDGALVEGTRRRLGAYSLAQLTLDMVRQRPEVAALPEWRPNDHAGVASQMVLTSLGGGSLWDGLPGLYTRAAFRPAVLPALRSVAAGVASDAWVLGGARPADADRVLEGALGLFTADYIRVYDTLLSSLTPPPMVNASGGARTLSVLITPPSPVAELLRAVAAETDLSPSAVAAAAAGAAANAATKALGAAAVKVEGALEGVGAKALGAEAGSAAMDQISLPSLDLDAGRAVTDAFAPLRRAASGPKGQPTQVEAALTSLEPLYRELNHIARGGNVLELGAEPQTVSTAVDATIAQLPPAVQPLFKRIETGAVGIVRGASGSQMKDAWNTTVLPACTAVTKDRFPFAPRSPKDAPIDDFKALFAPDGRIAAFRDAYLKPLIDTHAKPWAWRPGRPGDIGIGPDVLAAFEHADAVTRAFFPGGAGPTARFTLEVVSLDPKAEAVSLDIGGQSLLVRHGPATPMAGQWPAPTPNAPAVLSLLPDIAGERNMAVGEGPWGLFRLLEQAGSRKVAGGALQASFSLSTRQATIKLTPGAEQNPFTTRVLESFRCPAL